MSRLPSKTEWDTSRLLAEGRAYLESDDLSFEEIASQATQSAAIISNRIKPYNDAPLGEEDGRQIIFVVRVAPEVSDLLYNARDGMRGRYWQSPDHGFAATRYLIGELICDLMEFSERNPPTLPDKCEPMSAEDIKASLERISAKVWPRENGHNGQWLFKDDQLKVARWENNEKCAKPLSPPARCRPASPSSSVQMVFDGLMKFDQIGGASEARCSLLICPHDM